MNISKLATPEALEAVAAMETVEELRQAATDLGISFSGNTGAGTLRKKIEDFFAEEPVIDFTKDEDKEDEIIRPTKPEKRGNSIADLLEMDENQIEDEQLLRQVVRAKALRLIRVRITNLDPNDAQIPGAIMTAMNNWCGKVSRYISYGDENEAGQHVEKILLDFMKEQKFVQYKEKKGGTFGIKTYDTKFVSKFAIEELPMLTPQELAELAAHQRASNAIDK